MSSNPKQPFPTPPVGVPVIHPLINDPRVPGSVIGIAGYSSVAVRMLALQSACAAILRGEQVLVVDFHPELGWESVAAVAKLLSGTSVTNASLGSISDDPLRVNGFEPQQLIYREVSSFRIPRATTVASLVAREYSEVERYGHRPGLVILTPLNTPCEAIAYANKIPMEKLPDLVIAQGKELVRLASSSSWPAGLIVCHPIEWHDFAKHDCKSWIPNWFYLGPDKIRGLGLLLKTIGCGDDAGYSLLHQRNNGLLDVAYAKTGDERRVVRKGR